MNWERMNNRQYIGCLIATAIFVLVCLAIGLGVMVA